MSADTFADLRGRTVLVTGANSGIGQSLAHALAAQGMNIAVLGRRENVASAAEEISSKHGVRAVGVQCDVTSAESVSNAFDVVADSLGAIEYIVNSAGISIHEPAETMPVSDFDSIFNINVRGTFLVCQQGALRAMADQRHLSIVNVSSISGFAVNVPQKQAAYNASKAAVSMLTKSLAIEWLPHNIRVNAVAPGYIASAMTQEFVGEHPELLREWQARTPMGRMGTPEELGPLVAYLLSESASRYVVGQTIIIDGGYTSI